MFKLLILKQNITDQKTIDAGLLLYQQQCASIGLQVLITQMDFPKQVTAIDNKNGGYEVNPSDLEGVWDIGYDGLCFIFDASKITPSPTNPVDNGPTMQIPIQWFTNNPQVLADYLLHETCHLYFNLKGQKDITHLINNRNDNPVLYDAKIQNKPQREWYLYLLSTLIGPQKPPQAPVTSVTHQTVRIGSKGADVVLLQQKLGVTADGKFGPITQKALVAFQASHGLTPDGICGPKSWSVLLAPVSKLDLWCKWIAVFEGAKPERNNPGNLRFIGQQYAVNDNGFCKFDTYEHGLQALKTLLINACTGKSSLYNPNGTLYDFYEVYAPSSDGNTPRHYAEFIAQHIGVLPTVIIKTLV